MNERLMELKDFFIGKKHHEFRKTCDKEGFVNRLSERRLNDTRRVVEQLRFVLENEEPHAFTNEKIALIRTLTNIPGIHTENEFKELRKHNFTVGRGFISNICVDYSKLLYTGFDAKELEIRSFIDSSDDDEKIEFWNSTIESLHIIKQFCERYRLTALEVQNNTVAESFSQIPAKPPRTFLEALQMMRVLQYTLWCAGHEHNTLGRIDQYLYPYLQKDMDSGLLTYDDALELIEEFFLSFNRDNDLYPGIQKGDNGQSLMLGGINADGSDGYNILSELCLKASLNLSLIDPKINLRVHKDTKMEVYELAALLTKQGLGFPQYSNDDIVLPALKKMGYGEDSHNYTVAACWEFIIPGKGLEIPNIDALSFGEIIQKATTEDLMESESFDIFYENVNKRIFNAIREMCNKYNNIYFIPSPYISAMMDNCIEQGRDASKGCKYNNYAFHGTGLSTAADSLAAIKKYIFYDKTVSKEELLDALRNNYDGYDDLLYTLRYETPKMGNNDDFVDDMSVMLLNTFADSLEGIKNDRGGIYRAGTGSAMYYIWHSQDLPPTPDGRKYGEPVSANYSPSLISRCKGPVSIIRSFTKPDLKRTCNGGPLTLELDQTVFRNPEAITKTAYLVKSFMDLGGHQLQLNSVNRDILRDARKHPEKHLNLIVRVWGWSGYFVELDKEYQDHILARTELSL